MSIAAADGCRETPWRQDLAAAMLECATSPILEVACGEALLESAMAGLDARDLQGSTPLLENPRGFVLRSTLVATAEALLDRPDARAALDSHGWRQSTLALGLAHALLRLSGPVQGDPFQCGMDSLRMRYALGHMAAEAPDRLAADMRHGRDEALDRLTDAHHLLRLAASAWQLAHEGEAVLGAVEELLDQAEGDVAASLRQVTEREPLVAITRPESESRPA